MQLTQPSRREARPEGHLWILQVFYDAAYALPFSTLEFVISPGAPATRRVTAEVDRTTRKATYRVPLAEGVRLGRIPEPDVEGRVFKAPNGKVTVYGRLVGSLIEIEDCRALELIAGGGVKGQDRDGADWR